MTNSLDSTSNESNSDNDANEKLVERKDIPFVEIAKDILSYVL